MVTTVDTLIDKLDTFEIVRDQIGAILVENVAAQKILAAAAGEDPALWDLLVFVETSKPFEIYLNDPPPSPGAPPIVNVWYQAGRFEPGKSDPIERQAHAATYNIDVYGFASATVDRDDATQHVTGDYGAALAAHRGVRLVRNILMAGVNTYLQLRGVVSGRWPGSIQSFTPQITDDAALRVVGMQLALDVGFNEFSPQITPGVLDEVGVQIFRDGDGKLLAEADFVGLE